MHATTRLERKVDADREPPDTEPVAHAAKHLGVDPSDLEIVAITTSGDRIQDRVLT